MIGQKTYDTFQEAKIDNPTYEICVRNDHKGGSFQANPKGIVVNGCWKICNPSDYCMTVEEFLKAGYEFVDGDLYINYRGRVCEIGEFGHSLEVCNIFGNIVYNRDAYILHAAALEKPKRTKVEYVKVTESIFDLKDEFERGELYIELDGEYEECRAESTAVFALCNGYLYRRIETEIDERQDFIDCFVKSMDCVDYMGSSENIAKRIYDSGKFKLIED